MTGEVNLLTEVDPETFAIKLRRLHPWIANHNDVVMFLLKCNMDIKFVGSGEAAKAFLYYITDYITKAQLPVHAALAALSYAIDVASTKFPTLMTPGQVDSNAYVGAMTSTVNSMMGHQEISHPQVLSYLIGGGDHYSSHEYSVLWWGSVLRYVSKFFVPSVASDSSVTSTVPSSELAADDLQLSLALGVGAITASNQLLDYIYRCTTPAFEALCLYEFVCRVGKRSRSKLETRSGQFSDDQHPQYSTHALSVRKVDHVPVLLGPKIHRFDRSDEERELWAYDVAVLFKPWRVPTDLKSADETWLEVATRLRDALEPWKNRVIDNMNVLSECRDARREHRRPGRGDVATAMVLSDGLDELVGSDRVLFEEQNPYSSLEDVDVEGVAEQHVGDTVIKSLLGEQSLAGLRRCLIDDSPLPRGHGEVAEVVADDRDLIKLCSNTMFSLRKRRRPDRTDTEGPAPKRTKFNFRPATFVGALVPGSEVLGDPVSLDEHRSVVEDVIDEMNIRDNAEQLRAIRIVAKHVLDGGSQLLMYVAGVGGTGKSHFIKAVVRMFSMLG
ncbi:hypothetical protein C8R47DRAFT_970072, partial [Mycena vitilis]